MNIHTCKGKTHQQMVSGGHSSANPLTTN